MNATSYRNFALTIALALAAGACQTAAPAEPASSQPTAADPAPAQDQNQDREREPEAASGDCGRIGTDAALQLDFDGDGQPDTVSPALGEDGAYCFLEVQLASGTTYRLGAPDGPAITHRFYVQDKRTSFDDELVGFMGWKVHEAQNGRLTGGPPIPGASQWEISEARGDGLYLAGTDAAALVYLADSGWVYTSLGY